MLRAINEPDWHETTIDHPQRNQSPRLLHFALFNCNTLTSPGHWFVGCRESSCSRRAGCRGKGCRWKREREGPVQVKRKRRRKLTETKDDRVKRNGFKLAQVRSIIVSTIQYIPGRVRSCRRRERVTSMLKPMCESMGRSVSSDLFFVFFNWGYQTTRREACFYLTLIHLYTGSTGTGFKSNVIVFQTSLLCYYRQRLWTGMRPWWKHYVLKSAADSSLCSHECLCF